MTTRSRAPRSPAVIRQQSAAATRKAALLTALSGYPGTHDVAWGVTVLTALRTLGAGSSMDLPGYDRSAFEGTGDRMPEGDWRRIDGPVDLVVLEGWMLGFTPVVDPGDPDLRVVNEFLRGYAAWHSLLDGFIWLEPEDYLFVRAWRLEAEERAIAAGRAGMHAPSGSRRLSKPSFPPTGCTPPVCARGPRRGRHICT